MAENTRPEGIKPRPKTLEGTEEWYPLDQPQFASQRAFYQKATGIQDPVKLKEHLLETRKAAFAVAPYTCIRGYTFLQGKVSQHPAYEELLALGRREAGRQPFYVDLGCFLAVDVRQAVVEGYPADSALGVDLHPDFFPITAKLFNDPENQPSPVKLLAGDIFDPSFLDLTAPPPQSSTEGDRDRVDLNFLNDLMPLVGRVRAISANSFFHLFDEAGQTRLAQICAKLMDKRPGGMIFGSHLGLPQKGHRTGNAGVQMFCHSPDSIKELWEEVFGKGHVQVEANMRQIDRQDAPDSSALYWTATLL